MESEYSDDSVSLHGSPAISNRQVSLPSTMRERSGSTRHRGFASPLGESSSSAGFSRGSSWGIADRNNYDIARSSARASNSAPWNTASHSSRHSQKHRDIDVGGGSATAPSSWGGLSRHFATADRDSADLRYNGISPAPSSSRTFKHSPSPPISHLYAQRSHLLPSSEDSQRDPASLLHFDYRSAGTNDPLRLQTSATGVGDNFVPDTGSSSWSLPSTGNHHAPGLEWPPTRAQSQYSVDTNTSGYDDFPQRQLAQWSPSDSTPESTYSPLQTLPETPSIGFDEDQSSFASSSGLTRPSEHYSSGFYN
ncbi:hypothetical protein PLICRDRAFT_560895 [Plicaturopsis crispa FD-325 SS-3]|nr:hypothetical protein PLICRDRAFT_560895 [Plicaturopsis crispa FD-325 SS-3]